MKKSLVTMVLAGAAFCMVMTGCTTSYLDGGAETLYRPSGSCASQYYTEYDISNQRVTDAGTSAVLFWVFQFSEGKYCLLNSDPNVSLLASIFSFFSPTQVAVSNAKKAALYNALSRLQADQLLGAVYEYTVRNYLIFTSVDCKVKGYPATVKGVKFHDKKAIILNKWQKIEYVSPEIVPQDCSSKPEPIQTSFFLKEN